jgi:uncharacterized protein (DUF433 family)
MLNGTAPSPIIFLFYTHFRSSVQLLVNRRRFSYTCGMGDLSAHNESSLAGYIWIVRNPDRFGGKPTIRGTRFTVSFILSCLAEGMSYDEIVCEYSEFPRESLPEVLRYASKVTDDPNVAA